MHNVTDYLGFIAAICTTSAFIPQAVKVWRHRTTADISGGMYVLLIIGLAFWLSYGIALNAWPIILANGVTLILAASILIMKWRFERTAGRRAR
jgi:MtN3 and saliva related transmembrane protein